MVNALLRRLKGLARRIGWGRALSASLLVALVFFRAWDPLPLELLRHKIFDLYQNAEPREVEAFPVVIVDVDDVVLVGRQGYGNVVILDRVVVPGIACEAQGIGTLGQEAEGVLLGARQRVLDR